MDRKPPRRRRSASRCSSPCSRPRPPRRRGSRDRRLALPGDDRVERGRRRRQALRVRPGEPRRRRRLHGEAGALRPRRVLRRQLRGGEGRRRRRRPLPPRLRRRRDAGRDPARRAARGGGVHRVGRQPEGRRPAAGARRRDPFDGLDALDLQLWMRVWLRKVEAALRAKPIIYTNHSSWVATGDPTDFALAGHRLWVAQWEVNKPLVPAAGLGRQELEGLAALLDRLGRRDQRQRRPRPRPRRPRPDPRPLRNPRKALAPLKGSDPFRFGGARFSGRRR